MKNESEIRKTCYLWIAIHDDLKERRATGFPSKEIRHTNRRLEEATKDLRDAVEESGV